MSIERCQYHDLLSKLLCVHNKYFIWHITERKIYLFAIMPFSLVFRYQFNMRKPSMNSTTSHIKTNSGNTRGFIWLFSGNSDMYCFRLKKPIVLSRQLTGTSYTYTIKWTRSVLHKGLVVITLNKIFKTILVPFEHSFLDLCLYFIAKSYN